MFGQANNLWHRWLGTYLLLLFPLLIWRHNPGLIPAVFVVASSLIALGSARFYFRWKERRSD